MDGHFKKDTMTRYPLLLVSLALAAPLTARSAQTDPSACQKEVKDYVNTLRFIRETSGHGIGGRVEQAFVNETDLARLVQERGPCGAAQVLRQKGAGR